ncbi:LytTR family two component transcriptional regulator [Celerinatantimonas diazotrophica]|uniref:LytTR family two component transcriptional regulator n=2 Tax=Celerinatantimonas diazotrophica TaxID=412034 RepID=A0A4R1J8P4_9GAMM|nr:LytTR family two component transcriptional regulator [Celerinatantimonas diazotrophica]CAG9295733.1 Transcriptional regulatory protein YpdB [Celerinatantimonas diazotrophica]
MRAIIVEDEPLAQQELAFLIEKYSQIEVVGCFDDGLEAFKFLQSNEVDIAFLDINVPSIDGMLLAKNIHQFARRPYIVFTTAYKEYAVDAFELEAFDYLLKPVSEKRVQGVLNKLEQACKTQPTSELENSEPPLVSEEPLVSVAPSTMNQGALSVASSDGRIVVIKVADICYLEANEKVTYVVTAKGQYSLNQMLSEVVKRLPERQFFRCHRSYCVNLEQIAEIIPGFNSTYQLRLRHVNTMIPVSRSNLKLFRELMQIC